jgi:hypothetical protein
MNSTGTTSIRRRKLPGCGRSRLKQIGGSIIDIAASSTAPEIFVGLHFKINRTVQDKMPTEKFEYIDGLRGSKDKDLVWPDDRWWLEPAEVVEFKTIGQKLEAVTG